MTSMGSWLSENTAFVRKPCDIWRSDRSRHAERSVPEEIAVAFSINGGSLAVMMATPGDLHDFAVGFCLSESVVASIDEIESINIIKHEIGLELQIWISALRANRLNDRRRRMAGPTGCGLCGIETLAESTRALPSIRSGQPVSFSGIMRALSALSPAQTLHHETRAVHAAGYFTADGDLINVREDIGRHNALDKLYGALARAELDMMSGFVVITSRISVELVQKAATLGTPLLVAISAPTALAIRTAETTGITLVAVARDDGFEVFTHPDRICEIIQSECGQN